MKKFLLLIPEKGDSERDAVAEAWKKHGGEVKRIGKFWEKPTIEDNCEIAIYGNDTFSLVLAQILDLQLISPKDEFVVALKAKWTKRRLTIIQIFDTSRLIFPVFLKPVKPKLFVSKVYNSLTEFHNSIKGLDGNELVICSEVISIEKEVRAFILKNKVADLAFYHGEGNTKEAKEFIDDFIFEKGSLLPKTFVLDIGFNKNQGWFVIEFNSVWGAGLNNCRPEKIISCIKEATSNDQKNQSLQNS